MSLAPGLVMANQSLSQSLDSLNSSKIPDEIIKEIKQLKDRNIVLKTRPTFCPLNSTRNDVILSSVKNIEAIFKDDCLDSMQGTLDQVLTGAEDIQTSINDMRTNAGEEVEEDSTDVIPASTATDDLNGQQMASLVNGLNTLFNKNKCTYLDDTSFLENSANIIQNFSQFGLYSPSPTGVSVAYGGLVAGSILKFINKLFEGRFDFEKDEDRVTFIKLNCSFYDVRIKMQEAGILDISTDQHYKDLARINKLITILSGVKGTNLSESKKVSAELDKIRKEKIKEINSGSIAFLDKFEKSLVKIEAKPGFPVEAQKDALLDLLTSNFSELSSVIGEAIAPRAGERMSRQNKSFIKLINALDEVNNISEVEKLEESSVGSLNNFVENLDFHLNRIITKINKSNEQAIKDIEKIEIKLDDRTLKISEISGLLASGRAIAINSSVDGYVKELELLKTRLELITGKKEFSSLDGGDGADLRILEANDKVVNYLYGDYGKDFIEHMRKKSGKVNDLFVKDFKKFAKKNLEVVDGYYRIKDSSKLSDDQIDKACVSAKNLRGTWKYGQKWAEMGYDFLSTNKDIFGETGSYLSNDRDKIFNNSQGAVLARRIISAIKLTKKAKIEKSNEIQYVSWNGKKLTISEATELISDDFKYTLGKSMLEINDSRPKNGLLQQLYSRYRCDLRANYEK